MSAAGPADDAGDLFAQVFALLTPERLLHDPRATGEGVRVCIVDSGVDRAFLEERFRGQGLELWPIEGGIFAADQSEPLPYRGQQSAPHGTSVAEILLTLAPRVRLFSADVFGPAGAPEMDTLLRALHWAIHVWRCHIINLSLGIPEHRLAQVQRRYQFLRAIEEAYYRDILVVAAAHNEHPLTRSFPAMFAPSLLSVDKQTFADPLEFAYELRAQIEFQAHARARVGPFANEPATSWAAPHLAGIAARLLSHRPGLKPFELKTLLYWLGQHYRQRRQAEKQ